MLDGRRGTVRRWGVWGMLSALGLCQAVGCSASDLESVSNEQAPTLPQHASNTRRLRGWQAQAPGQFHAKLNGTQAVVDTRGLRLTRQDASRLSDLAPGLSVLRIGRGADQSSTPAGILSTARGL